MHAKCSKQFLAHRKHSVNLVLTKVLFPKSVSLREETGSPGGKLMHRCFLLCALEIVSLLWFYDSGLIKFSGTSLFWEFLFSKTYFSSMFISVLLADELVLYLNRNFLTSWLHDKTAYLFSSFFFLFFFLHSDWFVLCYRINSFACLALHKYCKQVVLCMV